MDLAARLKSLFERSSKSWEMLEIALQLFLNRNLIATTSMR